MTPTGTRAREHGTGTEAPERGTGAEAPERGTGVREVTDADFGAEVLRAPVPVLVEFTAAWCAPCRMMAPVLEQLAAERAGTLRVVTIDVDHNPGTQAAYNVLSMPTLMVFRDGEPQRSTVGARPKRKLLEEFAEVL